MKKRYFKFLLFLSLGISFTACNPTTPTPIVMLPGSILTTPTVTVPSPTPSPSVISTPEPTAIPTLSSSPSPVIITTSKTAQIPVMPEAVFDEMSTELGLALSQLLGHEVISYNVPASLEAVGDFYRSELTTQGWEWIYTDIGESLALSRPAPILIQEFKQDTNRLAVVVLYGFGFSDNTSPALVIAGANIASDQIISSFVSLIASGLDLGPPNEGTEQPHAIHFTSPLIQFSHPSNWLPTRLQMISFETDTNGNPTNVLPLSRRCANDDEICFVNFAFLTGSLFDVPVMIRVYPDQIEITIETFDDQRWARLVATAENSSTSLNNVERPEDLIDKGSLEPIETKPITLQDGTPAFQRFYRWRQVGLSTPLVSSYTLFKRNDAIIEFHTDFTEDEWATFGPVVQEVISDIQLAP